MDELRASVAGMGASQTMTAAAAQAAAQVAAQAAEQRLEDLEARDQAIIAQLRERVEAGPCN